MKTIVLEEPGRFIRTDTPEPGAPGQGEALVRVHRVGICGTDLHAFRGRQPFFSYPRILGHELGVEIVELGAGATVLEVGDLCAVEPYLNCGQCLPCRQGRTNCCASLEVLGVHVDGGMREAINVPVAKLHRSRELPAEHLALVETLGIGAHACQRGRPGAGETVLVIGAGPIGLSVIQFATLAGARVHVLELDAARRAFAEKHFAIASTFSPETVTPEAFGERNGGERPTLVLDATGNPQSMHAAFDWVESTGRLVLVGIVQGAIAFEDPEFHRRELTLLSSRNSVADDFRRIIAHLEAGEIDVAPWLTHRASYDELVEEFPAWTRASTGVVKAVLEL